MAFKVSDCYLGIQGLLMNRTVGTAILQEALRKSVLELTEDYKHPLLEETGPVVALVPYQNVYIPGFFLGTLDMILDVEKVNSFFLYTRSFETVISDSQINSGYDLKFRSINNIENLLNIPGVPVYWSRNNNKIYMASMPNKAYQCYMRYQKQHPSTQLPGGFGDDTPIQMADTWQEIVEYAAAIRIAPQINLANKKEELHSSLYGDQKFQTSGGIEGTPGLIFQRTSQRNRDQGTTTRRLRLRMG